MLQLCFNSPLPSPHAALMPPFRRSPWPFGSEKSQDKTRTIPQPPHPPLHPTRSTSPLVPRTPLLRPILRNRGPQPAGLRPPRLSSAAVLPQKKTGRRSRPVFDKSVPRISSGLVVRHRTTTTFFATTRINRRPAALFSFDRVEHWKSRRSLVQRIDWPHH
jgi:hypothetical protein